MLTTSSDNFRVFILCGANVINNLWTPMGLNFENFKAEAANSLLKIVEESPARTLFIFLSVDKFDIISTIISRSQVFYVPSFNNFSLNFSGVKEIFEDYPNFDTSKLFIYSDIFKKTLENHQNLFDKCQNYLLSILKLNSNDNLLKQRVIEDINIFEKSKQMYKLGIKADILSDDLFLALMRR
jgi:DNA polymerase III delta prime subunit